MDRVEPQLARNQKRYLTRRRKRSLNAAQVSQAVDTYIRHKMDQLASVKGYDGTTKNIVEEYLTANANGTFLWVGLVIHSLNPSSKHPISSPFSSYSVPLPYRTCSG